MTSSQGVNLNQFICFAISDATMREKEREREREGKALGMHVGKRYR